MSLLRLPDELLVDVFDIVARCDDDPNSKHSPLTHQLAWVKEVDWVQEVAPVPIPCVSQLLPLSLCNRRLRNLALPLVFRTLYITSRNRTRRLSLFLQGGLKISPLLSLVRSIVIDEKIGHIDTPFDAVFPATQTDLSLIVHQLSGLTNVSAQDHDWLSGGQILKSVLHCENLKRLSVHCLSLADFSLDIQKLQNLKLKSASFGFKHRHDDFEGWSGNVVNPVKELLSGSSSTTLESLTLLCSNCSCSDTHKLLTWQSFSTTSIDRPSSVIHSICDIIPDGIVFTRLKSLTVRSGIFVEDVYFTERAESFPSLTTLKFERCPLVPASIDQLPRRIASMSSSSSPSNSLERLENLQIDFLDPREGLFSSPLPSLKSLEIHFKIAEMGLFERVYSMLKEFNKSAIGGDENAPRLSSFALLDVIVNRELDITKLLPLVKHVRSLAIQWNCQRVAGDEDTVAWKEALPGLINLETLWWSVKPTFISSRSAWSGPPYENDDFISNKARYEHLTEAVSLICPKLKTLYWEVDRAGERYWKADIFNGDDDRRTIEMDMTRLHPGPL